MNAYSACTTDASISTANTANTATPAARPSIEREIREAYVGFDETALMLSNDRDGEMGNNLRQHRFFRQIDDATRNYHRRVWISEDTLKLLEKEADTARGARATDAANALSFVKKLHESDRLQVVDHQAPYADIDSGNELTIICTTMRERSPERLTVFTQRAKVADALLEINRTDGLEGDKRISVFRVTVNGYLGTFLAPSARVMTPRHDQFDSRWNEQGYEVLTRPRPAVQAANNRFGPNAVEVTEPAQPSDAVAPMHRFQIQSVRDAAQDAPQPTSEETVQPVSTAQPWQAAPAQPMQVSTPAAPATEAASVAIGQLTQLSNDFIPLHYAPTKRARTLGTGSELRGDTGMRYTVGEAISSNAGGGVYRVEGNDALCIKLYAPPTRRQQVKARLLMGVKLEGLLTPTDLVYTTSGSFCGYVMPLVRDAVRLSDAFSAQWRTANAYVLPWQRDSYVRAALRVAEMYNALYQRGVCYPDASADHVLITRNAYGQYDPACIILCAADHCQVDSRKLSGGMFDYGVIPGEGMCPDMLAPELQAYSVTGARLLSEASVTYHTALLAFQACMAGVHPFTAEGGTARSYQEAIRKGEFAFSSFGQLPSGLTVPAVAEHLFSNTPTGFKSLMYDVFSPRGKMNALDQRPAFSALLCQLRHYAEWIGNPANAVKAPEYRSLAPEANKPFQKYCSTPGCVHHQRFAPVAPSPEALRPGMVIRVGKEYYCYNCYHAMQAARYTAPAQDGWYLQTGC